MGNIKGLPIKIKSIKPVKPKLVYDLSVDDEEWSTFVASGILVHNSATPTRVDRTEQVFFWHIGEVGATIEQEKLSPKVYRIFYPLHVDPALIRMWNGEVSLGKLNTFLGEARRRSAFIAEQAVKAYHKGRRVLVLSDRLDHLRLLEQQIRDLGVISVAQLVGGMGKESREKALEKKILLGTYQLVSEAFDHPALDTLIMATPKSRVEQCSGRILRVCEGKKAPMIVDIIDAVPLCRALANKRLQYYQSKKFEIEDVEIKDTSEWADEVPEGF